LFIENITQNKTKDESVKTPEDDGDIESDDEGEIESDLRCKSMRVRPNEKR